MSATSSKADHGSVESKDMGQSHIISRRYANQTDPGRSHQMLRYLNDPTYRPVTETLLDPSHVPGVRNWTSLDILLCSALSHNSKPTPPQNGLLTKIGAQFSDHKQGTVRPAKLDLIDVASTAS